jgi:cytochrome oxidase Cu insertion factor (SCO1/SenC/PrrC family)
MKLLTTMKIAENRYNRRTAMLQGNKKQQDRLEKEFNKLTSDTKDDHFNPNNYYSIHESEKRLLRKKSRCTGWELTRYMDNTQDDNFSYFK